MSDKRSTKKEQKTENLPAELRAELLASDDSLFFNPARFEHAQRVAQMFAQSDMVGKMFKNKVGNCFIALNYADRLRSDPFMVMQNIYMVHGRPGLEGKLVAALVNSSGKYEPLRYHWTDDNDNEVMASEVYKHSDRAGHGCYATAIDVKTQQEVEGPKISWSIVKGEGWFNKDGSKWKTIPQLMFMYRAASWFANINCPEVKLGMQTVEELTDFTDMTPGPGGVYKAGVDYTMPPGKGQVPPPEPEPPATKPDGVPGEHWQKLVDAVVDTVGNQMEVEIEEDDYNAIVFFLEESAIKSTMDYETFGQEAIVSYVGDLANAYIEEQSQKPENKKPPAATSAGNWWVDNWDKGVRWKFWRGATGKSYLSKALGEHAGDFHKAPEKIKNKITEKARVFWPKDYKQHIPANLVEDGGQGAAEQEPAGAGEETGPGPEAETIKPFDEQQKNCTHGAVADGVCQWCGADVPPNGKIRAEHEQVQVERDQLVNEIRKYPPGLIINAAKEVCGTEEVIGDFDKVDLAALRGILEYCMTRGFG